MKPAAIRLIFLALLLFCAVGCDQTTKHIARTELGTGNSLTFPGGFGELHLAENPGSFLNLGASLPAPWRMALLTGGVGAGLAALLLYLALSAKMEPIRFIGLALVQAGGTSNLIDRIARQGLVTDFVFLRVGPLHTGIFNLADVLVMLGIGILIFEHCRRRRKETLYDHL